MNTKTMLRQLHLDKEALENIRSAVQKAEAATNGEIALSLASESAPYGFWELLASVVMSAVVFIVLLPFSGEIQRFSQQFFWSLPVWFMPFVTGCALLSAIVIFFFLVNIPFFDRLIIPQSVQKQLSYERALRCFTESGVYKTKDSSGILVFASYLEKKVYILADSGIAEKIEQNLWDSIAAELARNLGQGNGETAFVHAVEQCGSLLAEKFPAKKENPDELPDGLVIL